MGAKQQAKALVGVHITGTTTPASSEVKPGGTAGLYRRDLSVVLGVHRYADFLSDFLYSPQPDKEKKRLSEIARPSKGGSTIPDQTPHTHF